MPILIGIIVCVFLIILRELEKSDTRRILDKAKDMSFINKGLEYYQRKQQLNRGLIMTREEAKELLPIMQAFAEGKTIQSKQINAPDTQWRDIEECNFLREHSYRIKPEPKYRPFSTQEECWNEMHKHPDFGWLYYKDKGYYVSIDAMGDRVGMNGQKFVEAFSDYTFTDGEPFGITREESKEG